MGRREGGTHTRGLKLALRSSNFTVVCFQLPVSSASSVEGLAAQMRCRGHTTATTAIDQECGAPRSVGRWEHRAGGKNQRFPVVEAKCPNLRCAEEKACAVQTASPPRRWEPCTCRNSLVSGSTRVAGWIRQKACCTSQLSAGKATSRHALSYALGRYTAWRASCLPRKLLLPPPTTRVSPYQATRVQLHLHRYSGILATTLTRHMGQSSSDGPHVRHTRCPHWKAKSRGLSQQMGQMDSSAADGGTGRATPFATVLASPCPPLLRKM